MFSTKGTRLVDERGALPIVVPVNPESRYLFVEHIVSQNKHHKWLELLDTTDVHQKSTKLWRMVKELVRKPIDEANQLIPFNGQSTYC